MGWFDFLTKRGTPTMAADRGKDPGYGISMQFFSPGQPIWSDKNYLSFVREGYKKNPTVYTCISKIATAAAGIKWRLYTDQTRKKTIDRHDLLTLWNSPNNRLLSASALVEQIFGFWHIAGNSYMWAYRTSPSTPPLALWTLRPDLVKAVAGPVGIEDYVYGYGSKEPRIFQTADVMHLKFSAYDDDIYGLSPLEVASYLADQINESMGWNTALMQNMGRPASVFISKNYLTLEQRNQVKEELRRKYSGKRNAGMPLVLEADMTWQNMSLKPAELDWLQSRAMNKREIAAVFDIAPELIGDAAGKTFANVAEARQALYLENVLPKMDRLEDHLNSWLVPMYPDLASNGAYFGYDRKDIEALAALFQMAEKAVNDKASEDWLNGIITLNEARELKGYKPAQYGDYYRYGSVLVSVDSIEEYADQSLSEPAAPPTALSEPLNIPPAQQLPPPKKSIKYLDSHGVYQPDDLDQRLKQYQDAGVEYLTWQCNKHPCDVCIQNNGVTVKTGAPFPSGHILPGAHPNCDCQVIPAAKKSYEPLVESIVLMFLDYLEKRKNGNNSITIDSAGDLSTDASAQASPGPDDVPLDSAQSDKRALVAAHPHIDMSVSAKPVKNDYRAFIERLT